MELKIRKAVENDLPEIMKIVARAIDFMASVGNPNQWSASYPSQKDFELDIKNGNLYVCTNGEDIEAMFAMIYGNDPWYEHISQGQWLNDEPYAAVHRMASAGRVKGIAKFCLDWCLEEAGNLRIDTYEDNALMRQLLSKLGFTYCGIIAIPNVGNGIAFQKVK